MSEFRRRIMMSLRTQVVNPYPPDYVDDGRLWAYVTVPSDGTYRISDGYGGNAESWSALEIDGNPVSGINRDQYLTAGSHLLKYTLKDPTKIGGSLLRGMNDNFTMWILPGTVTTLGDYFCYGTSSHGKILMDKSKITYIGTGALFHSYVDFGNFDFPALATLKAIGDYYAAPNCRLKNLGIITDIPEGCFRGSHFKDSKYIIPATVTSIGNLAYYNNIYDAIFYVYATTPPTLGGSQVWFRWPAAIYVPAESVEAYKAASGWSTYASVIYPL